MLAALRTLRATLSSAIGAYERAMRDPDVIVLVAMRICGLAGCRCDGEFSIERYLRDILSSPIMINNERILGGMSGSFLLRRCQSRCRGDVLSLSLPGWAGGTAVIR